MSEMAWFRHLRCCITPIADEVDLQLTQSIDSFLALPAAEKQPDT
jgi:hypothetical protein